MGLVLDILLKKMEFLRDNPILILNENWMMTMFHGLFEHKCVDFEPLLELKEYFRHLYEVKQMSLVGRESGAKIMELQVARRRLWNPMNKTDQDTNSRLVELVSIAMPAVIKDMLNTKKLCWWNLSLSGGPLSYAGCNGDY